MEQAAIASLGLGQTAMIPFAKEIVPVVDRVARRIHILPPEGLLNIQGMLKSRSTTKKGKRRSNPKPQRQEESDEESS